jgi:hypothetical protein
MAKAMTAMGREPARLGGSIGVVVEDAIATGIGPESSLTGKRGKIMKSEIARPSAKAKAHQPRRPPLAKVRRAAAACGVVRNGL